ncbi:MAG: aldolase/citrate lyase family protein, partial [Thaumarchaeota archaeon]|nr:aldolase/citrate lyase family protein [Nitrososphaerota archaeon]
MVESGAAAAGPLRNPVKRKLQAGKASVGTWLESASPDVAEQLAGLGFDWLLFDVEHGVFTFPQVQQMMQAMAKFSDCVPLVRVPINEPVYYKWALDIGAWGVVVPMVSTREEAERAVSSSKYPPLGSRGCGPRRVTNYGERHVEYVESANDETLLVVMIETAKAMENLDEILSVRGIDAVFIGPDDLSLNLGVFEQWSSPTYRAALEKVLASCRVHGVAP